GQAERARPRGKAASAFSRGLKARRRGRKLTPDRPNTNLQAGDESTEKERDFRIPRLQQLADQL
ncbi:MAG: hypothetical protein ACREPG_00645, partial [Candidatus Binatia bacterium]